MLDLYAFISSRHNPKMVGFVDIIIIINVLIKVTLSCINITGALYSKL